MSSFQEHLDGESPAARYNRLAPVDPDEKIHLRVACAWCGEVLEDGPGPMSHGMCRKCMEAFLATIPEE